VLVLIIQKKDTYGAWEYYLGLEHSDTAPKRAHQTNQVFIKAILCQDCAQ